MDKLLLGVRQLSESSCVRVRREQAGCQRVYSVSLARGEGEGGGAGEHPDQLVLVARRTGPDTYRLVDTTAAGAGAGALDDYKLEKSSGKVGKLHFHHSWRELASVEVRVRGVGGAAGGSGGVWVRARGPPCSALFVSDRRGQQLFKIRPLRTWASRECKILRNNDTEMGSIIKNFSETDVVYPASFDMRLKLACIGAIILLDRIEERCRGAPPPAPPADRRLVPTTGPGSPARTPTLANLFSSILRLARQWREVLMSAVTVSTHPRRAAPASRPRPHSVLLRARSERQYE